MAWADLEGSAERIRSCLRCLPSNPPSSQRHFHWLQPTEPGTGSLDPPEPLPRTFVTYQILDAAGRHIEKRNHLCKSHWMQFVHVGWKFSMLIRLWLRLNISWPPNVPMVSGLSNYNMRTITTGGWNPKVEECFNGKQAFKLNLITKICGASLAFF